MADFTQAVQKTLIHEGGFVDSPNDPGGATKYGITQADMPGVDMKTVTQEHAIAYYAAHYWNQFYTQIVDQAIAEKLFDMGVLFGVKTAVKMLQITLVNKVSLVTDGEFGPGTLSAVNQNANLLPAYRTILINHCMNVVNNKPETSVFVSGWVRRINS
jgi:lysozyme family protein